MPSDHSFYESPVVTVLIPVHNGGMFLQEAVRSILHQTFSDFECLVINDGSTDGAVDALRSWTDPRLRLVNNQRNLGLIATLNRGLEMAKGRLLARMDADDLSLPTRLERQVARFEADKSLALLGTWAQDIDAKGQTGKVSRIPTTHEELVCALLRGNSFIHPSVMARTSILREVGGFPPDALHAEDYALWLRIASRYPVANLPEVLLHYRIHPGQVSQRKLRAQREMANNLRSAASRDYINLGLVDPSMVPPQPTRLDKLRGRPGTLGADYLSWSEKQWKLGNARDASRAAINGLCVAPLSGELWRMVTPPKASPRFWIRKIFNFLR